MFPATLQALSKGRVVNDIVREIVGDAVQTKYADSIRGKKGNSQVKSEKEIGILNNSRDVAQYGFHRVGNTYLWLLAFSGINCPTQSQLSTRLFLHPLQVLGSR